MALSNVISVTQETAKLLKRQLCAMEDMIVFKTTEAKKLHGILTDKEAALHFENKRLIEQQNQNNISNQIVKSLTAECQNREEELVALKKAALEQLTRTEQYAVDVCQDLDNVSAKVTNWKNKAEQLINVFNELKATSEAEMYGVWSVLEKTISIRDQFTEQQLDTSNQLEEIIAKNQELKGDVKIVVDRKAGLMTEIERLKQKLGYDRLALVVQQTKSNADTILHEDDMTVKWHTLTSIKNEVEVLRQACKDRESVISDVQRKLDAICSIMRL